MILRIEVDENGEEILVDIEDDDEYERVVEVLDEFDDEEFYFDEDDDEDYDDEF